MQKRVHHFVLVLAALALLVASGCNFTYSSYEITCEGFFLYDAEGMATIDNTGMDAESIVIRARDGTGNALFNEDLLQSTYGPLPPFLFSLPIGMLFSVPSVPIPFLNPPQYNPITVEIWAPAGGTLAADQLVGRFVGSCEGLPTLTTYFDPGDDRINRQAYANVAVYCDAANSRVAIYGIDEAGSGYPALFVNEADLPPTPTEEQGHLLVAESGNIRLYRMTTGELQVRNGPDADGKEYAFIWDGCPATGGTAYTIENGIATRAE